MKNLVYVMAIGLLVLTGCSKEESNEPTLNEVSDTAYVLRMDGSNPTWESVSVKDIKGNSEAAIQRNNGNSAHMHGEFTGFGGGISMNFSGTENNGGTHGSATMYQTLGAPFNTTVEITMETECVMLDGNEGVYGGTITAVANSPFPPGGPFDIGNHIYFKVIDNGQGNNAASDQYNTGLVIFPSFASGCGAFTPSSAFWSSPFVSVLDVENDSDKIKIN